MMMKSAENHSPRIRASALLLAFLYGIGGATAALADEQARRGVALYEQEDFDGAVEAFRAAAKANPEDAGIQYDLGTALAQKQEFSEAADVLNRTLSIESETLPGRNVLYNLGYSQVMAAKKRIEGAQGVAAAQPPVAVSPSTGQTRPIQPGQITMPQPGPIGGPGGEQVDPKELMEGLRQGMASFRKAVLDDPTDEDAKYNYETARLLLKQLEEQMQQQQQQQKQNGEGEQDENKDEENQDQQDGDKQNEQNQDQQNKDQQGDQKSDQEQEPKDGEQQDQKDGEQQEQESKSDESEEKEGKDQKKPDQGTPTPRPSPRAEQNRPDMQPSQPENPQPLTPEQLDALRVLNSLEQDNPEQFKRLFQDQSARRRLERDW